MTDSMRDLLRFIDFTNDIRAVKRALWVKGEEEFENDSEHSFQVALVALYVIEQNDLPLNAFKAMAMSVVHDVVEVYAGDTPSFGSVDLIQTQAEREEKARNRLQQEWPQSTLMHRLIDEYETRETAESKFVYALDKLIPILNNYLDNGRNWKREKITLADHIAVKSKKIAVDPVINQYYQDMLILLERQPELFT